MRLIDVTDQATAKYDSVAGILKSGGICAFPTETVYGLGCSADNEEGVKRIFEIKGRSFQKPLTIHVATFEHALKYIKSVPVEAQDIIEKYLPGPLMMIFEKTKHVKDAVTCGLHKVGIRVPSNPTFRKLFQAFGEGIAATSANISGYYSPVRKEHVVSDLDGRIDALIFDNDDKPLGIESTIIDFTIRPFRIIRSGFINKCEIMDVLGKNVMLSGDGDLSRDVNMASKARIILFEGERDIIVSRIREMYEKCESEHSGKVGVIVTEGSDEKLISLANLKVMGSPTEPEILSRNFYSCLRDFDKKDIDIILVEGISREGIGWAIMDRLSAMASQIIK